MTTPLGVHAWHALDRARLGRLPFRARRQCRLVAHLGSLITVLAAAPVAAQNLNIRDDFYVANGPVEAVLRSDNTLYIAGNFSRVGPPTGCAVPFDVGTGQSLQGFPRVD